MTREHARAPGFLTAVAGAAIFQMKNALQLEFLAPVASAFCGLAIAAWAATAVVRISRS